MTNKLGPARSWRLIHDCVSVLMLEQLSGITETVNQVFEAQTVQECLAEIGRLGLPTPDEYTGYSAPVEPPSERDLAKAARTLAVDEITVTTTSGNTFDGDEVSQGRMARAIITLQSTGTPTTIWVLHDNSVIDASAEELGEALALAGAAQSALWVLA